MLLTSGEIRWKDTSADHSRNLTSWALKFNLYSTTMGEKRRGQKKEGIFIQAFSKIQAWHRVQRHLSTLPKKRMKSQKLIRFKQLPTFKKHFRFVSILVLIHHRLQRVHMIQHCFVRCWILYTSRVWVLLCRFCLVGVFFAFVFKNCGKVKIVFLHWPARLLYLSRRHTHSMKVH